MRIYAANSIHQKVKPRQRTLKLAQCRYASGASNPSLQLNADRCDDKLESMKHIVDLAKPGSPNGS
jgi:hypothetical protein